MTIGNDNDKQDTPSPWRNVAAGKRLELALAVVTNDASGQRQLLFRCAVTT